MSHLSIFAAAAAVLAASKTSAQAQAPTVATSDACLALGNVRGGNACLDGYRAGTSIKAVSCFYSTVTYNMYPSTDCKGMPTIIQLTRNACYASPLDNFYLQADIGEAECSAASFYGTWLRFGGGPISGSGSTASSTITGTITLNNFKPDSFGITSRSSYIVPLVSAFRAAIASAATSAGSSASVTAANVNVCSLTDIASNTVLYASNTGCTARRLGDAVQPEVLAAAGSQARELQTSGLSIKFQVTVPDALASIIRAASTTSLMGTIWAAFQSTGANPNGQVPSSIINALALATATLSLTSTPGTPPGNPSAPTFLLATMALSGIDASQVSASTIKKLASPFEDALKAAVTAVTGAYPSAARVCDVTNLGTSATIWSNPEGCPTLYSEFRALAATADIEARALAGSGLGIRLFVVTTASAAVSFAQAPSSTVTKALWDRVAVLGPAAGVDSATMSALAAATGTITVDPLAASVYANAGNAYNSASGGGGSSESCGSGCIAGAVVGSVVGAALIAGLVAFSVVKQRRSRAANAAATHAAKGPVLSSTAPPTAVAVTDAMTDPAAPPSGKQYGPF